MLIRTSLIDTGRQTDYSRLCSVVSDLPVCEIDENITALIIAKGRWFVQRNV
jgi:hypothetical protein